MKVDKQCRGCSETFQADTREIKRGNANFCSIPCARKHSPKIKKILNGGPIINCSCRQCNKPLHKPKSRLNTKTGNVFCSRLCKETFQKEQLNPPTDYNYRRNVKIIKGIHICERCGYDECPNILQVHHIDCNRNNNIISNLRILCPTCHEVEHFLEGTGRYRKKGESCTKVGETALQAI